MSVDQVMEIRERLLFIKERLKEAEASMKAALMDYIEENGEFTANGVRYYVGAKSTTKCVDVQMCIEAMLRVRGGDLGKVIEGLASEPLKQGAVKVMLGQDAWDKYFVKETVKDLKTGKPVREAKAVDERFLPVKKG
jgi:hypothetical protein